MQQSNFFSLNSQAIKLLFLTTMENDVVANINKSSQSIEKQPETNIKPCKRHSKKSRIKNCFQVGELEQIMLDTPLRRRFDSSDRHKSNNESTQPTKVKSASWKRSEKSTASFNTLTNKKHKKSSNWLRFSNSKMKKSDTEQPYDRSESLSACRPGTTYSDVLFGAGCSNLVKIKNCITPRFHTNQSNNANQKKLTKSLFKLKGNPNSKTSEESEAEEKKTLFPALLTIKNKFFPASLKIVSSHNNNEKTPVSLNTSCTKKCDETEVPTLPEMENLNLNENKTTYGNCMDQHLQHVDGDLETTAATFVDDNKYLINSITNIPKWNFTCVETGTSDGFPKFLCQFDDENYLKAENMALLGLKLALGNCAPNSK